MTTPQNGWLTRREAAQRAGVHLRTIDRWLGEGRLIRYRNRVGGVRIGSAQLDRLTTPEKADA